MKAINEQSYFSEAEVRQVPPERQLLHEKFEFYVHGMHELKRKQRELDDSKLAALRRVKKHSLQDGAHQGTRYVHTAQRVQKYFLPTPAGKAKDELLFTPATQNERNSQASRLLTDDSYNRNASALNNNSVVLAPSGSKRLFSSALFSAGKQDEALAAPTSGARSGAPRNSQKSSRVNLSLHLRTEPSCAEPGVRGFTESLPLHKTPTPQNSDVHRAARANTARTPPTSRPPCARA